MASEPSCCDGTGCCNSTRALASRTLPVLVQGAVNPLALISTRSRSQIACAVLFQGAVTVFALAVPSVMSLLVLLRNEAARGIAGTKLEWVRARVEEQCKRLEGGLPLTFPLDALMVTTSPPHLSPGCSYGNHSTPSPFH